MKRIYKLYLPILVVAVLVSVNVVHAQIGGGVGWFNIIQDVMISGKLQVNGSDGISAADVTTTDDLVVGDDFTVTDDSTFTDDVVLGSDVTWTVQGAATVTNGAVFTPTGALQPITAAGAVTPTIAIAGAGKCYTIYNTSSNAILIVDTGNAVLGGNFTMGQYDVLSYCGDGTRNIERARSNN
jgi:hypothetical protein